MKFDLEKALKGGKAITRDGREVTQLTKFHINENAHAHALAGVVAGGSNVTTFREDGRFLEYEASYLDLQNIPEKLSGFINVYEDGSVSNCHVNLERAMAHLGPEVQAIIDFSQFNVGHGLDDK